MGEDFVPAIAEKVGDYVTVWHCDPPPDGSVYRVLSEKWAMVRLSDGGAERHVYEWELVSDG